MGGHQERMRQSREWEVGQVLAEVPALMDSYKAAIDATAQFHQALAEAFLTSDFSVHHVLLDGSVSFPRGSFVYTIRRETNGDDLENIRVHRKATDGSTTVRFGVYSPKKDPLTGRQGERVGTWIQTYGTTPEDGSWYNSDRALDRAKEVLADFVNQR